MRPTLKQISDQIDALQAEADEVTRPACLCTRVPDEDPDRCFTISDKGDLVQFEVPPGGITWFHTLMFGIDPRILLGYRHATAAYLAKHTGGTIEENLVYAGETREDYPELFQGEAP